MKTNITLSGACGNSPKNAFAEQFAAALLSGDTDRLNEWLAQGCTLVGPGAPNPRPIEPALTELQKNAPDALEIFSAITHGRIGAVDGVSIKGKKQTGFALFLEFKNTRADSVSAVRLYSA